MARLVSEIEVIPVLSAFRAVRYKTFVGIFLTLSLSGCIGGAPAATLTWGPRASSRRMVTVDAGKSFDLEVVNDTKAVQTVTVAGEARAAGTAGREEPAPDRLAPARRLQGDPGGGAVRGDGAGEGVGSRP
jgi:hypothetical protein